MDNEQVDTLLNPLKTHLRLHHNKAARRVLFKNNKSPFRRQAWLVKHGDQNKTIRRLIQAEINNEEKQKEDGKPN